MSGPVHQSFPPIVTENSKVLILGSMPGAVSLAQNQYYAHPQNLFWKIMFSIFELPINNLYEQRIKLILDNDLALWESLQYCERPGSLDSNISNEVPNDFKTFFEKYPQIHHVIFNGQASYKYFKKYVGFDKEKKYLVMPSTSPAHAGKSFMDKLSLWKPAVLNSLSNV